ncbi:hypothetical protein [Vibrio sp. B1FLJ16]|uniref:hypothetical protein n=1 Tax=Vibrio sp. B1FLJ16 TaxID=2751178 RepID=UPI0015F70E55|nr:hypothetical protein [Vibrio sp. B1FLJ16]CAD7798529.1 hypothetical protein ACOMICROBIO_EPCKBFOG_00357 [Vibrio sp. B1FLJ16]CAE6883933.1 hypothetical protein ACOMICROBIO_EPCKBFOG_00357 [Vibrio sp. B1FLJ16]
MIEDEVSYRDISDYFSQIRGEISNPMLSYLITVFFIQHAEVDSYCPNIVSLLDNYRNKLWVSDELKWIVRSETCKNFNTHEECCLNLKSSNLTVDETFILDLDYLKSDYLKMIKNYD